MEAHFIQPPTGNCANAHQQQEERAVLYAHNEKPIQQREQNDLD